MTTATLTPDRGDRPHFMSYCERQLLKITAASNWSIGTIKVTEPPVDRRFDLVKRVRDGIRAAEENGFQNIIMVESDDNYPNDYVKYFDFDNYDIIGWGNTTYYNLKTREWQTMYHEHMHSSLCSTGFRIAAFKDFRWPPDDHLWLDIELWKFAKQKGLRWKLFDTPNPVVGIKHGVGRYGGKGHSMALNNKDPQFDYLKTIVDEESFNTYMEIAKSL